MNLLGSVIFTSLTTILLCITGSARQSMAKIKIPYLTQDFAVSSLHNATWDRSASVTIVHYWSGKEAPAGRQFAGRLLWSKDALYVRFEANQAEPLAVSETPDLGNKTLGLWERDVCEIFIAPDKTDRNRYFEFEIAPTGEWVDLSIEWLRKKRKTDLEYASGLESSVFVEPEKIVMAIKIPWKAFGKTPKSGDIWLGNIFRCIGKGPTRGYLAWQATKTAKPNFHVPSKFGEFEFE